MISCCMSSISSSASSRSMILMATTCWVLLSMPLNTSPKLPFPIRSCFVNISSGSTFCNREKSVHVYKMSAVSGVAVTAKVPRSFPRSAAFWQISRRPGTAIVKLSADFAEARVRDCGSFSKRPNDSPRHRGFQPTSQRPTKLLAKWKKSRILNNYCR